MPNATSAGHALRALTHLASRAEPIPAAHLARALDQREQRSEFLLGADQPHLLPLGQSGPRDLGRVHQHDHAVARQPPQPVGKAVDRGVELVVRAQRDQVDHRAVGARHVRVGLIGVAGHHGARILRLDQAQQATGQRGSKPQIGVAVHPGQPVFQPPRLGPRDRHPQPGGAVVAAPFEVDRRRKVRDIAAIAVHIGRQQRDGGGQMLLHSGDEMQELGRFAALLVGKDVAPRLRVHDRNPQFGRRLHDDREPCRPDRRRLRARCRCLRPPRRGRRRPPRRHAGWQ